MSDPVPPPHPLAVMLAEREQEIRATRPAIEEEPPVITEKECTRCHKKKPVTGFNKWSRSSDGLQSWCRDCQSQAARDRQKPQPASRAVREPEPREEEPTTPTPTDDATSITWVFTGATITSPFDPTLSQLRRLQAALRDDLDPGLDYDLESVVAVATVVLDALKDSDA